MRDGEDGRRNAVDACTSEQVDDYLLRVNGGAGFEVAQHARMQGARLGKEAPALLDVGRRGASKQARAEHPPSAPAAEK